MEEEGGWRMGKGILRDTSASCRYLFLTPLGVRRSEGMRWNVENKVGFGQLVRVSLALCTEERKMMLNMTLSNMMQEVV